MSALIINDDTAQAHTAILANQAGVCRGKKVALKELEKLGTLKQQGILTGLFPAILCFQNVIFHSKV